MLIRLLITLYLVLIITLPGLAQELNVPFHPAPQGPYFISPQLTIDSADHDTIILKIEAQHSGTGRLFWAHHYDPRFNPPKSLEFALRAGQHDYYFNVAAQNPNWIGWIKGLLFYPDTEARILEAKVVKGDFSTKLRSAWQEMLRFEAPQLRSVNFIYGPKINGKSVNLYIYLIIILLSALILAIKFIKSRDLNITLRQAGKNILIVCLVFWLLLDGRIIIDQIRTVRLDLKTFAGKTLNEKRAALTLGDYYDFLKFAEAKLPPASGFNMLHPTNYYYVPKANYYLYPRHFDAEAEYLLVYDPNGSLSQPANEYRQEGFRPFAKLKQGQYILKK